MTDHEDAVMRILSGHKGRDNAIRGNVLARRLRDMFGGTKPLAEYDALNSEADRSSLRTWERRVRKAVNGLIFRHGIPIIGDHSRGYYLVGCIEELEAVTETLKKHGLHELWKAAMLKKVAPAELIGQLVFDFQGNGDSPDSTALRAGKSGTVPISDEARMPHHLVAITTMLGKYRDDPERYAEEIREIQERFSPLFVSREDREKLEAAKGTIEEILKRVF